MNWKMCLSISLFLCGAVQLNVVKWSTIGSLPRDEQFLTLDYLAIESLPCDVLIPEVDYLTGGLPLPCGV